VLIFISHRRKEVYQRTREREESEVGKAAPPGGSPPWVSGDRRRRGSVGPVLGHQAFWPVRSEREERKSGPLSVPWAGPVRRRKGARRFLFFF
jgi:hypothetical protein